MKVPRDLSGRDLIKLLSFYGYKVVTQKGSHIKITTQEKGEHHLAIPNHNPLKTGTLNAIIRQVAGHFEKTKDEILADLFSR
jgi:predicted RNA binding protein YcfA (HicA-like mRNA interferase family)